MKSERTLDCILVRALQVLPHGFHERCDLIDILRVDLIDIALPPFRHSRVAEFGI